MFQSAAINLLILYNWNIYNHCTYNWYIYSCCTCSWYISITIVYVTMIIIVSYSWYIFTSCCTNIFFVIVVIGTKLENNWSWYLFLNSYFIEWIVLLLYHIYVSLKVALKALLAYLSPFFNKIVPIYQKSEFIFWEW